MKLSASEAARRTGKSVPTITRAIKSGKISAEKSGLGVPDRSCGAFRAFPAVTKHNAETPPMLESETPHLNPSETPLLQKKIASLEAALADAKAERDEWRDQAKRLAMALPPPTSEGGVMQRQGMWARLLGKTNKA